MSYKWKRVVSIWKHCKDTALTGLDFNAFIGHYFLYDRSLNGYILVKTLGNE